MKKLSIILLSFFFCIGLTACDPGRYLHFADLVDEIVAVELIYYDNPNAKVISTFFSTRSVQRFNSKKMEIIEELNGDRLEDFLQDLSGIEAWTGWSHSNSPFGISLKITYSNDEFEVVSDDGVSLTFFARYNSKGRLVMNIGGFNDRSDFADLVNNHFETQISDSM